MKFIVGIVLTAALGFVAGLFLPWWSIAVVGFLTGLLTGQRGLFAFLSGFIGLFILWGGLAWWIDSNNGSILSERIARLLPLGGSSVALILVTALLGGIVAGLASLTGSLLRYPKT